MDEKSPIKLSGYVPCRESTVELRFTSDIPSEAILGFVFQKLQNKYSTPKSLPIMQLPQDVRERDPNLRFAPFYIMENESFQINIGPRVLAIINRTPYVGWEKYYSEIRSILSELANIGLFKTITRLGVRYINFFDATFDMLSLDNIKLVVKSPFDNFSNTSYTTLVNVDDFTSMLKLQADSTIIMQNHQYQGTVIDIDTFKNFQDTVFDIENVLELFNRAHRIEKKVFFSLLTEKFKTETLGAEYDD